MGGGGGRQLRATQPKGSPSYTGFPSTRQGPMSPAQAKAPPFVGGHAEVSARSYFLTCETCVATATQAPPRLTKTSVNRYWPLVSAPL